MQQLSPQDLTNEWRAKKTRTVCCLTGEERALKDAAVKTLLASFGTDAFNFSEYDAETAEITDLVSAAQTPGLLCDKRLILLKGAEKLKKEAAGELAAYVSNPSEAAMLVILIDKKTDAAEKIIESLSPSSALADFAPLEGAQGVIYAKKLLENAGLRASMPALELLAEVCSYDAATMYQEVEKLSIWRQGSQKQLEPEDIMDAAGFSRTLNPFEFSNALTAKNGPLALEIAEKMLNEGTEPVGIAISTAYTVEKLLKVKKASSTGQGDAAAYSIGMNPWAYKKLLGAASSYTLDKLLKNLNRCLEIEAMLKSSSGRDPRLLIKQLIFEVTR